MGRIALGGVLNGRLHVTTRSCSTYAFNNVEYCDSSENRRDRDDGGMLGLAGAVMF